MIGSDSVFAPHPMFSLSLSLSLSLSPCLSVHTLATVLPGTVRSLTHSHTQHVHNSGLPEIVRSRWGNLLSLFLRLPLGRR